MGRQQQQRRPDEEEHEVVVSPEPAILIGAIAEGVHNCSGGHHQEREAVGQGVMPPPQSQRIAFYCSSNTHINVNTCKRR